MEPIGRIELAQHRLKMAREKLESSKLLLEQLRYGDAASRAYYALLHGARALLATRGLDSRKHSGIISLFNHNFVKNGQASKEMGKLLMSAKDIREDSDYNEFYVVSKQETVELVNKAEEFIGIIAELIKDST